MKEEQAYCACYGDQHGPYRVPNSKPTDIVRGTAGIASTCLPNSPQTTLSDTTVHGSNLWHLPLKQHNRMVWKKTVVRESTEQ